MDNAKLSNPTIDSSVTTRLAAIPAGTTFPYPIVAKVWTLKKKACQKRPISPKAIEDVVEKIVDEITDKYDSEVPGMAIGERVMEALRSWDKPALVVWGGDDRVLPLRVAEMFVGLIPGARGPVVVAGASHFLQEDRGEEVAERVLAFVRRT